MSLDALYDQVKDASYPLNDRDELIKVLGNVNVEFEGDFYDARDIGTMVHDYPILKASHLIELFINSAEEYELSDDEAEDFREIEDDDDEL